MNNELTKEFIPFEEAKELKALGFDEPCLGWHLQGVGLLLGYMTQKTLDKEKGAAINELVLAPTWRQAFKFFEDKFNLFGKPYVANMGAVEYSFDIYDIYEEKYAHDNLSGGGSSYSGTFDTPEEAELACLKKLIEIAKKAKPKDPHEVSKVKCDLCSYTWVAVRPEGLTKIECPHCGNMVNFENIPLD